MSTKLAATGNPTNWRSKQGSLQLYTKKKWKEYFFKVTGNTYLHYFSEQTSSTPKEQIFISTIKSVEIPLKPPKGGEYIFEIKHTGKTSPWIINASSYDEQIQWMEVLQPGCTAGIRQKSHHITPPLSVDHNYHVLDKAMAAAVTKQAMLQQQYHQYHLEQEQQQQQQVSSQMQRSQQVPYQQMATHSPQMPRSPQRLPQGSPHLQHIPLNQAQATMTHPANDINHSLPASLSSSSPQASQHEFKRNKTIDHPPSSFTGTQVTNGNDVPRHQSVPQIYPKGSGGVPLYPSNAAAVKMHDETPSPERQTSPVPPPRPAHTTSSLSPPTEMTDEPGLSPYLEPSALNMPPSSKKDKAPETDYMDMSPANSYMRLKSSDDTPPISEECAEAVKELQDKFTPDQLSSLAHMLQKLQVGSGTPTQSLSGNGTKDLGVLLTNTSSKLTESLLVTEEDDPAFYDKRPQWAKAVYEEQSGVHPLSPESSFDILLDVNHISRMSLTNMAKIGAGQFGEVYKADYLPEDTSLEHAVPVAVKTTKADCSEDEKRDFLREMAVMSKMIHPNIVRLYGVVTEHVPSYWIVLEYLPHGDLKSYLCKSEKKPYDTLVKYMVDVAMGMHYIAERGLIHRDLAARNVLIGHNELCKVADFGLLRKLPQDNSIYQSTSNVPCPIRWMAPESLASRQFSVASDVWSYGILLWEMLQPSKIPYERMDNFQVAMQVSKGYRMPIPRGCPPVIARVMKACVHANPAKRPSFLVIVSLLTTKFTSSSSKPGLPSGINGHDPLYI